MGKKNEKNGIGIRQEGRMCLACSQRVSAAGIRGDRLPKVLKGVCSHIRNT